MPSQRGDRGASSPAHYVAGPDPSIWLVASLLAAVVMLLWDLLP